jgi:hypothetical protein
MSHIEFVGIYVRGNKVIHYTSERNLKSSTGKSLGNPTVVFNAAIISSPLKNYRIHVVSWIDQFVYSTLFGCKCHNLDNIYMLMYVYIGWHTCLLVLFELN